VNSLARKIVASDMFMHCSVLSATCTAWTVLFISKLMCQIDTVLKNTVIGGVKKLRKLRNEGTSTCIKIAVQ